MVNKSTFKASKRFTDFKDMLNVYFYYLFQISFDEIHVLIRPFYEKCVCLLASVYKLFAIRLAALLLRQARVSCLKNIFFI